MNSITVGARSVVVGLFLVGMPLLALPQVGAWLKKQDFSRKLTQLLQPIAETAPPQLIATGPETPAGLTSQTPVTAFMGEPGNLQGATQPYSGTPANAFDTGATHAPHPSRGTTPPATMPSTAAPHQNLPFQSAPPLAPTPGDAFVPKPTPQLPHETADRRPPRQPPATMPHADARPMAQGTLDSAVNPVVHSVPAVPPAVAAQTPGNQYNGEPWYRVTARIQNRLRQLGARFFKVTDLGAGQYRCRCEMPLPATPVYRRTFTATAADPLQAMQQVLQQVEKWSAAKVPPAEAIYRHET